MTGLHMRLWFTSALLPEGWRRDVRVTLRGARIASVEAGVPAGAGDERHGTAVPGMANLHSHAFQRAMSGLTETRGATQESFWTWRQTMYRFLDRLAPEDVEAVASLAYAEMLESGFTRVGEFHYLHHDRDGRPYDRPAELSWRIAAAAAETGIGLTLLPVFYAHSGFGGAAPSEGQRRFVTDLDSFSRLVADASDAVRGVPGADLGIAPHSLRAVTPDELRHLVTLGERWPIHLHVAEQTREVEDCVAWSGRRPVEWLLDNAPVDRRWCLIHATHMTSGETTRLAASGATAGLCPLTEANLGDGVFPAHAYREAGGHYGIGSDSNVRIDMPLELMMLEYSQRLTLRGRNVMADAPGASTGRSLFEAARLGGARALGQSALGIEPGAPADLVTLAAGDDADATFDHWIFGSRPRSVAAVWRHGRQVVADGRHVGRDAIAARYRTTLARILGRP